MGDIIIKLDEEQILLQKIILFLLKEFEDLKTKITIRKDKEINKFKESISNILGTKKEEGPGDFYLSQDLLDSLVDQWNVEKK